MTRDHNDNDNDNDNDNNNDNNIDSDNNDNRLGKGPLAFLYHNQLVWDRESWPRKKTHSPHCCMELSFQGMAEA